MYRNTPCNRECNRDRGDGCPAARVSPPLKRVEWFLGFLCLNGGWVGVFSEDGGLVDFLCVVLLVFLEVAFWLSITLHVHIYV